MSLFKDQKASTWKIFHDESGIFGQSRYKWIVIGLLFISENIEKELYAALLRHRQKEEYYEKIHFCDLKKDFKGKYNKNARVSKGWFTEFIGRLGNGIKYYALAINQKHLRFQRERFSEDFYIYNKFTSITLKSAFSWLFPGYDHLEVYIFSDKKIERPEDMLLKKGPIDNFHEYIEKEVQKFQELNKYKGPKIKLIAPVKSLIFCKGTYSEISPPPKELEFLQLCDLVTGAIGEAIRGEAQRASKIWFAKEICKYLLDIRKKKREQEYDLWRKFNLSYFPSSDSKQLFYGNGELGILEKNERKIEHFFK